MKIAVATLGNFHANDGSQVKQNVRWTPSAQILKGINKYENQGRPDYQPRGCESLAIVVGNAERTAAPQGWRLADGNIGRHVAELPFWRPPSTSCDPFWRRPMRASPWRHRMQQGTLFAEPDQVR